VAAETEVERLDQDAISSPSNMIATNKLTTASRQPQPKYQQPAGCDLTYTILDIDQSRF
jgi:hypothetical protein